MIDLIIKNQKVDLTSEVSITLNGTNTDFINPTAVKVAFSKTISLEGTPNNNKIFSHLYKLEGSNQFNFDTSIRNDAVILNDGVLIDSGYITLDKINIRGGKYTYEITFYSALGQFFYNLKYNNNDEQDEEKTLCDLYYGFKIGDKILTREEEDKNILIQWTKDYIADSWIELLRPDKRNYDNLNTKDIRHLVTAAPTYSGYYDDFDNNKIMSNNPPDSLRVAYDISTGDWNTSKQQTKDWFIFEAPRDLDENEVCDLRSLYQRPAIKMKAILDAISNPENNGGYNVEWPEECSRVDNALGCYYNLTWIVNDRFSFDDYNPQVEYDVSIDQMQNNAQTYLKFNDSVQISTTDFNTPKVQVALNVNMPYSADANLGDDLYLQHFWLSKPRTNIIEYTFSYYDNQYRYILCDTAPTDKREFCKQFFPMLSEGYFDDATFLECKWQRNTVMNRYNNATQLLIDLPNIPKVQDLSIAVTQNIFYSDTENLYTNYLYPNTTNSDKKVEGNISITSNPFQTNLFTVFDDNRESKYYSVLYDTIKSLTQNTAIDKKMLFQGSKTPLDYLLNFTKLLNMRFIYDKHSNTIKIIPYSEYYTGNIINIEDKIDRLGDITINPNYWEAKVYKYQLPTKDSYIQHLYKKKSNKDFLCEMYNTKNNVLTGTKDVLSDFIFNSVQDYTQQSVYYNGFNSTALVKGNKWSVQLYKSDGNTTKDVWFNKNRKAPDLVSKLCLFDKENKSISDSINLVFLNSCIYHQFNDICVTDNLDIMYQLNGNACYIDVKGTQAGYSSLNAASKTSVYRATSYVPNFSPYMIEDEFRYINIAYTYFNIKALYSTMLVKPDFQSTKMYDLSECKFIFEQFHQDYLSQYFKKENKEVELMVKMNNHRNLSDMMRDYYYFDNSLWTLNKITDLDVVVPKLTKCSFIKIGSA